MRVHRAMRFPGAAIAILGILGLGIPVACTGQEDRAGRVGVTAAVQGDQVDVLVPWWLSSRIAVVPAVGLQIVGDSYVDLGLGAGMRFALREGEAIPYLGVRGQVLLLSPNGADETITDFVLGAALGGEYLLNSHVGLGAEAQLNVSVSDDASGRFGNPGGTNLNTATEFLATYYF